MKQSKVNHDPYSTKPNYGGLATMATRPVMAQAKGGSNKMIHHPFVHHASPKIKSVLHAHMKSM